jgi:hypothetical protein
LDDIVNKQDLVKEKFNWEVPVEAVPIPSEGKVYPEGSPLFGKKLLEIKAMTAQEEDILSSQALIKQGTVITHLLKSCLIDKSINVDDMLIGDRNALMISVRITGYGADYPVTTTCKSCAKQSNQTFNLGEMEIKRLKVKPVQEGMNIFEFKLPVTGKVVHLRFLTGRDEIERSVVLDRMKKLTGGQGVEKNVTSRLESHIVSIDGIEDKNSIRQFVSKMPAMDSRSIRSFLSENEPGIDMSGWIECPHCSYSGRVALPIGANFFWPSS